MLYDIVGIVMTVVTIDYAGSSFALLDARRGFRLWGSLYFCIHIVAAVLYLYYTFVHKFPSKKGSKDTKVN